MIARVGVEMKIEVVVAGAGIWGCTVARRFAEAGRKVLVLEKRDVVGGNCRCEIDAETGIEMHKYGSHIFHTEMEDVWDYITKFTEFNGYMHTVNTRHDGKLYPMPLNLDTVNLLLIPFSSQSPSQPSFQPSIRRPAMPRRTAASIYSLA